MFFCENISNSSNYIEKFIELIDEPNMDGQILPDLNIFKNFLHSPRSFH